MNTFRMAGVAKMNEVIAKVIKKCYIVGVMLNVEEKECNVIIKCLNKQMPNDMRKILNFAITPSDESDCPWPRYV